MRSFSVGLISLLTAATVAVAKDIVITVGLNTTDNATAVFQPDTVTAQLNDIVVFNFTMGNHTVTQSLFATPCIPAHDANITINGFDSSFRDAGNGTAITILTVPITPEIENQTIWFFDYNTCGQGGVGGINVNESSFENTGAFIRNAVRLNGSDASSSSSSSSSHTSTSSSSQSTGSSDSDSAERAVVYGGATLLPLFLIAMFF